ncbi:MAG: MnhB domain-containing protein [Deltaproteobacteria bacterium]|nr:MnhB domain-containing protein [Deltaproteobacteria bacterium]
MMGRYDSVVVSLAGRVQAPLLQLYALYVLFHGHYSPGGGFQAGATLAGSFLIFRITEGYPDGLKGLTTRRATHLAILGVSLYLAIGILGLLLPPGTAFLDYAAVSGIPGMPHGEHVAAARALGTIGIEVGVTLAVMGVMVILFDDLVARSRGGL